MEYKARSKSRKKVVVRVPKRAGKFRAVQMVAYPRLGVPRAPKSFSNMDVLKQPPVLNVRHRSKLLYNTNVNYGSIAGAASGYVWTANGLWDTDVTGTGHQPMGFDQLMLLYEHYTVIGGKITVSFVNVSATESGVVGIAINPSASLQTIPSELIENGMLRRSYIAANAGNSKSQVTLTIPFDIAKINGVSHSLIGDALYRGDVTQNPTEQSYLHLFCYNTITASLLNIWADVTIEFDTWFTEPRKLVQS